MENRKNDRMAILSPYGLYIQQLKLEKFLNLSVVS